MKVGDRMKQYVETPSLFVQKIIEILYQRRNTKEICSCLSKDITWTGTGRDDVYEGILTVTEYLEQEQEKMKYTVMEGSFKVIWENRSHCLVEGTYTLESAEGSKSVLRICQCCSVLLERIRGTYSVVHIHISDCWGDIFNLEELMYQVQRDPLTQIYNARVVREQIQRWMQENTSEGSCTMLILDIDNFKQINDKYGHLEGNEILMQIARMIENCIGKNDIAGRVGGDEFIIFRKSGQWEETRRLVEKLEEEKQKIKTKGQEEVTVSIGIAAADVENISYEMLFERADKELYQAKASGKNTYALNYYGE